MPYIPTAIKYRLSSTHTLFSLHHHNILCAHANIFVDQKAQHTDVCEMRQITVIFVNLDFIYVRGLKELISLQKAVASMQHDIYQYDGSVRQFLVDDKGSVMIGVFGTPPKSHENDCSRAIMAALQLQRHVSSVFFFFLVRRRVSTFF